MFFFLTFFEGQGKIQSEVLLDCELILIEFFLTFTFYLPHEALVYPPKMYFPTRIMLTVGPLLLHCPWKVDAAHPSTDALQQRFQYEDLLCATGFNQPLNEFKYLLLFPTMTESANPPMNNQKNTKNESE